MYDDSIYKGLSYLSYPIQYNPLSLSKSIGVCDNVKTIGVLLPPGDTYVLPELSPWMKNQMRILITIP